MPEETPPEGEPTKAQPIEAVVFDVGGVLIDWNPRHLYRKVFDDEAEMEHFLTEVCSKDWNDQADAGRPIAEITAELCAQHPDKQPMIESYYARFPEMMSGAIDGTVTLLEQLHNSGMPLFVLSNFSAETFPHAQRRFDFFERFSGLLISGEEGMKKPDPRIYDLVVERFDLRPAHTLFIDDLADNTQAAVDAGWQARRFISPRQLEEDLRNLGLLG
ncbi:HAD family phosphatase [Pelagibius litoralis]|uniref:HAD family phosphatase n=1 Tax=Pelagibius litoralis TaxID=374515 RepID=A0A967EY52_9PROT|nr:HAD family phosphatase [Pelagibius litoralis]NIA69578.1 HAD family phosphatase [Pelagibius litoralis]